MKRFILTLATILATIALSAQDVSYANLVAYAVLTDIDDIDELLTDDGYEMDAIFFDEDGDLNIIWTWGACSYDEETDLNYSEEAPWAALRMILNTEAQTLIWRFTELSDFILLNNDLGENGWKLEDTEVDVLGTHYYYSNPSDNELFILTDCDDSYVVTYYVPMKE